MRTGIHWLLLVLALSACSSTPEPYQPKRPPLERAARCDGPVAADRGRVWLYRTHPQGLGVPWNFVLDDEISGVIFADSCYCYDLAPGAHQVSIDYIGNRALDFNVETGKVQFIRFEFASKLFGKPGTWPVLVEQQIGQNEIESGNCAGPGPVTANSRAVKAKGFEVNPPIGEHWFPDHRRQSGKVTFRKRDPKKQALPGGERLSFLVEIKAERFKQHDLTTEADLEAALKFALYESPDRYKYAHPRFEPFVWQNTMCIRYSSSREGPEIHDGIEAMFVLTVEGYLCRHPYDASVGVIGLMQEHRMPGTPSMFDDALRQEAMQVLNSVTFLPFR